ncbi:MAG: DUF4268 domain-containing protein [Desulfobaccales bacterium]
MDFAEQVRQLIVLLNKNKDYVSTEEATKSAMVLPFLQVLGYNIFDPTELIPEFTADIGTKKGEKVDYAVAINNQPAVLIEVKSARTNLDAQSMNQLLRYFGVTEAKIAILTNGIQYQFFSDLGKTNIMDTNAFLIVDLVQSIRDSEIAEIKKYHKDYFNREKILSAAIELKYTSELKRYFKRQFKEAEEEFLRFFIKKTSFEGVVTKLQFERLSPIVSAAFKQYVNEVVSDTLKGALDKARKTETGTVDEEISEKQIIRQRFWTQLLGYAKTQTDLHAKISPPQGGWVGINAGSRGLTYCYSITKHHSTVELYIDRGKDSQEENENIFDKLMTFKKEIDEVFDGPLEWEKLEGKRACRIKKTIAEGGYLDEEQKWPKIQEIMVSTMIRFETAFSPQINKLAI